MQAINIEEAAISIRRQEVTSISVTGVVRLWSYHTECRFQSRSTKGLSYNTGRRFSICQKVSSYQAGCRFQSCSARRYCPTVEDAVFSLDLPESNLLPYRMPFFDLQGGFILPQRMSFFSLDLAKVLPYRTGCRFSIWQNVLSYHWGCRSSICQRVLSYHRGCRFQSRSPRRCCLTTEDTVFSLDLPEGIVLPLRMPFFDLPGGVILP